METLEIADCRWKSERQAKKALVRAACEFVVDTRIESMVDGGDPVQNLDINRTLWLSKSCQKNKMAYFHLSSSRVFSGNLARLHTEDDFPDNQESVAKLLLTAEDSVRDHCDRHLILRLGPVFSHRGVNVLTHILGRFRAGETLLLENHLRGCPVAASDAARVISGLLDQFSTGAKTWGSYHYCSSDATNCYEFAEVLIACASQFSDPETGAVELVCSDDSQAQLNRSLDCSRLRNTFAIKQVPWRGFVADAVKLYFESHISEE